MILDNLGKWLKISPFLLFLLFLGIGTFFRLYNLVGYGFYFDTVETQFTWGQYAFDNGLIGFWSNYEGFFDYLPGSILLLYFLVSLSKLVSVFFSSEVLGFVVTLKLFNWLSDLLFVYLIYKFSNFSGKGKFFSLNFAGLVYSLPSFWFISGVWGQFDTLIALSCLLSGLFLYSRSKSFYGLLGNHLILQKIRPIISYSIVSGLIWSMGLWIKLQPLMILPILLITFVRDNSLKTVSLKISMLFGIGGFFFVSLIVLLETTQNPILSFLIPYLVTLFLLLTLKFIFKKENSIVDFFVSALLVTGFFTIPTLLIDAGKLYNGVAAPLERDNIVSQWGATAYPAFNLAWYPDWFRADTPLLIFGSLQITIKQFGYGIYLLTMGLIYYAMSGRFFLKKIIQKPKTFLETIPFSSFKFEDFILWTALSSTLYFMFFTTIHSRYLHIALVFWLVFLALQPFTRIYKYLFGIVLVLNLSYFANNLYVFAFKNNLPMEPLIQWPKQLFNFINFDLIQASSVINLICTVGLIFWTWIYYYEFGGKKDEYLKTTKTVV